ncbi:hypothetical protein [Dyadobacter sediminis]|uniref:TonB C-terminal domain-containing protein n=1 Tax=Dyadobacter sediminis TaxID=1493691 RepID=A0A5R9KFE9_9BACT|nr:hypothetical protein [Dyadobacter sediminis]TLU94880.1 hypothetical protein FEM55_11750 [Dyadobacter sediminis]GGB87159.1 hypothetical protein GCM10011325_13420 [Dyadobacter sediminis]
MKKPDKLRPFGSEDFRRYQQGEMSYEEQHAFEKQLLEDAFSAAAYAGFLALEEDKMDLPAVGQELNRKLENRLGTARKRFVPVWAYGAAASLFISIGILWTTFLTGPKMQKNPSEKQFSAREVPEYPDANEQEERITPDAPLSLKSPSPPTENKPETDRITNSSTVENSIVADRYEKESLFAETVPRQQQILKDESSRIASADKAGSEHGSVSERIISRHRESEKLSAIVPADENSASDSADNANMADAAGEQQRSENEIQVAAAPMTAEKQVSFRSSDGAMPEKGWKNYQDYLEKNAVSAGINAVVTVTFTVQPDGKLTRFSAIGDSTLTNRAIGLVRNGPAWLSAGKGAGQRVIVMIHFTK